MEEKKEHYVYGLYKKNVEYKTNRIDEHLFYVGITGTSIEKRARDHRQDTTINKIKLNIINKYDFEIKSLYICDSRREAEEREEFLIRWFGKIMDGGQLANVLDSANDDFSKYLTKDSVIKGRNSRLTVSYDKIIDYIDEWSKNPIETHSDFCKRKNISQTKFNYWIRKYKPEYINLSIKVKESVLKEALETQNSFKKIIKFIQLKLNISREQAKGIYYNHTCKFNYDKTLLEEDDKTEEKIKLRDVNLTVPYNQVIEYIEEWARNPNEPQSDFAKKIGVSRSRFKDWIRLYKPEYVGLIKRNKEDIVKESISKFINIEDRINYIKEKLSITKRSSKDIYNKYCVVFDETPIPYTNGAKTEEYKIKIIYDYMNSGMSSTKFSKKHKMCSKSLKCWIKQYENKGFKNESNLPIIHTPYDWVWKTRSKSTTSN